MHLRQSKSPNFDIFAGRGRYWTVGVDDLAVLACLWRLMTKKGRRLFLEEEVHPQRKILATPIYAPA